MNVRSVTDRLGKAVVATAAACLVTAMANAAPASDDDATSSDVAAAPPVLLFFEPGSGDVPASARPLANRALAEGIENWRWQLRIEPYVAPESVESAAALAERRADSVAAFLLANGVPSWRIVTDGSNVAENLDPAFGLTAERVEIHFRSSGAPLVAGTP